MNALSLPLLSALALAAGLIVGALVLRLRTRRASNVDRSSSVEAIRRAIANHAVGTGSADELASVDPAILESELTRALALVSGSARDRLSTLAIRHDLVLKWIETLRNGPREDKLTALEALALITDPSVIPPLTDALGDADARVRVRAAELLKGLRVELR